MPFITQGKANIKYLLIVVLVAIVAGGIIYATWGSYQKEIVSLKNTTEINTQKHVTCTMEAKICPDGSSVGRTGPNCEFAECPDISEKNSISNEKNTTLETSFSYPYPIEWIKQNTPISYLKFSITGASLGERTVPSFATNNKMYKAGDKIHALTLYLKVNNVGTYGAGICSRVDFRILLNEEGDLLSPMNNDYNNCFWDNQTYYDQEAIFVVPETQRFFTLTTGGESNIFFTITALDNGQLKLEKSYTGN